MKLLSEIHELSTIPGSTYLAIGVFDGIHRGHQAVIGRTVRNARQNGGDAVVVTFDPHPIRALRPAKAPRRLTAPSQKARLIEQLGVDAMLTLRFTREFAKTPPEIFIQGLLLAANRLREICVGQDWRFGANRSGGIRLLESLAQQLGTRLNVVSPILVDDRVVSSTRVRAAIGRGDLSEVARLLGRPFTAWGLIATEIPILWAKEISDMESQTEEGTEFCEPAF
jgi:riboflavin kinase / FMN adenylyltransferase